MKKLISILLICLMFVGILNIDIQKASAANLSVCPLSNLIFLYKSDLDGDIRAVDDCGRIARLKNYIRWEIESDQVVNPGFNLYSVRNYDKYSHKLWIGDKILDTTTNTWQQAPFTKDSNNLLYDSEFYRFVDIDMDAYTQYLQLQKWNGSSWEVIKNFEDISYSKYTRSGYPIFIFESWSDTWACVISIGSMPFKVLIDMRSKTATRSYYGYSWTSMLTPSINYKTSSSQQSFYDNEFNSLFTERTWEVEYGPHTYGVGQDVFILSRRDYYSFERFLLYPFHMRIDEEGSNAYYNDVFCLGCYDKFGNLVIASPTGKVLIATPGGCYTTSDFYSDFKLEDLAIQVDEVKTYSQNAYDTAITAASLAGETRDKVDRAYSDIMAEFLQLKSSIAPTITKVSGLNGATCTKTSSFTVVIDASGASEYRAKVDSGSYTPWTTSKNITLSNISNGVHNIDVQVRNTNGAIAEGSMTIFRL